MDTISLMSTGDSGHTPVYKRAALINGRYKIESLIGDGGFGSTYRGIDTYTSTPVAIKVEKVRKDKNNVIKKNTSIINEFEMYSILHPAKGIPAVFWHGTMDNMSVMVMELLGDDMEHLRTQFKSLRMPLQLVLSIGEQLIRRIELCHRHGIIHRDIKPDNVMMGRGHLRKRCFLADFGLAKLYVNPIDNTHIKPKCHKKRLSGSARYCSVASHEGKDQSRRDDMESLGYSLAMMYLGKLPWQGINRKASRKQKLYQTYLMKKHEIHVLYNDLPPILTEFLNYARGMGFTEKPQYRFFRTKMREMVKSLKAPALKDNNGSSSLFRNVCVENRKLGGSCGMRTGKHKHYTDTGEADTDSKDQIEEEESNKVDDEGSGQWCETDSSQLANWSGGYNQTNNIERSDTERAETEDVDENEEDESKDVYTSIKAMSL